MFVGKARAYPSEALSFYTPGIFSCTDVPPFNYVSSRLAFEQ